MGVDKIKISVKFDQLHKRAVKSEDDCRLQWKERYSWLPAEYLKIQNELNELSKLKHKLTHGRPSEHRSIKPVPVTSNGFYGWLVGKKEFELDIYGSDIMNTIPIPKEDILKDDD